jgi:hypothetical protein
MSAHRLPSDVGKAEWVHTPDPGSGKPLGIGTRGYAHVPLRVAAGVAETNTVPDPERPGLRMILTVYALGAAGTRALTFASKINNTPNTIITFDTIDETAFLESVPYAANTTKARWQLIISDGGALS